jgi:opacity protein-like surface antigen
MKKLLLVVLAVVALAMATAAGARAFEGGWTLYYTGVPTPNSHVHITNNSTGATGSTFSDSNGYYQFNGLVTGYSYTVWACNANNRYRSDYFPFTYPGYNIRIDLKEKNASVCS